MTHDKHHHCPAGHHVELCLKAARCVIGVASVVAAFCAVHEIHRLHHAVEHFREDHAKRHKLL